MLYVLKISSCYLLLTSCDYRKYSKSATVVTLLPFNVFWFDYFWLNR